jgi:hypothetical protein
MTGITDSQRRVFFSAIRKAASEVGEDAEVYRKRIMLEELGVTHLSDVSRGPGFDKLMQRVFADAGDYEQAIAFSTATASRIRYLIIRAAEEIISRRDDWRGSGFDYITGVMVQCGILDRSERTMWVDKLASVDAWARFTEKDLRKVFQMLITQVRREKKKSA